MALIVDRPNPYPRSPSLCWAVLFGAKCHQGVDDREARYRHALASCLVLALNRCGRPTVLLETRRLMRKMSIADRLCEAPRIHGELLKLGKAVSALPLAAMQIRHTTTRGTERYRLRYVRRASAS